ncbi:hypothetical protein H2200_006914 [Cladophialophora chaetospira]|uniref:Uncharacterized protein n=1 Tax=Cladophialophora chaetospira TaxID=386627 RepID=A0AA38X942_9EURO|nr:hypothetical protein H2200_006914 [Cladophialophora chaetospira]
MASKMLESTLQRREKDHYFDDRRLELEVMHDERWPRLKIRRTNEILSITMAARIIYILKHGHTFDCIASCHIKEEFSRELDRDTIEAILRKDFDVTGALLPGGEQVVPTHRLAIAAPGFISGTMIPSGIHKEIIIMHTSGPAFLADYINVRWGLVLDRETIATAVHEWAADMAIRQSERPGLRLHPDVPEHDGRTLETLRRSPNPDERLEFVQNPPPVYEPRPMFKGVVFRHPREVLGVDGHLPPFLVSQPTPPEYSPGNRPPSYHQVVFSGTRFLPPAERADDVVPTSTTSARPDPGVVQDNVEYASAQPFRYYSRINVVDYLFHDLHEVDLYPEGPSDPVRVADEGPRNMRSFLTLRAMQREAREYLHPTVLLADFYDQTTQQLSLEGELMSRLIPAVLREFYISSIGTSRKVTLDFPIIPSFSGICFLINHMRDSRGSAEMSARSPSKIVMPLMEELLLSTNIMVARVLQRHGPEPAKSVRTLWDLLSLLDEVCAEREEYPVIPLGLHPSNDTALQIVAPGSCRTTWRLTGKLADDYRARLFQARDFYFAMLESTTEDGFAASRSMLEHFLNEAVNALDNGTSEMAEIATALSMIESLKDRLETLRLSPLWWAAILTNATLARVNLAIRALFWMEVPNIAREAASTAVSTGSSSQALVSRYTWSEVASARMRQLRNLDRLRKWNHTIRRWPVDLHVIEQLIDDFQQGLREAQRHWPWIDQEVSAMYRRVPTRLSQEYKRELDLLLQSHGQILLNMSLHSPGDEILYKYSDWGVYHLNQSKDFVDRYSRLRRSPVRRLLDNQRGERVCSALKDYGQELDRVVDWYKAFGQLPLERSDLGALMLDVEIELSELEYECATVEEEMYREMEDFEKVDHM